MFSALSEVTEQRRGKQVNKQLKYCVKMCPADGSIRMLEVEGKMRDAFPTLEVWTCFLATTYHFMNTFLTTCLCQIPRKEVLGI
jgi:hypothetical protein